MDHPESVFDLGFVCRVLGTTVEQLENMCVAFGITPLRMNGESMLGRDAIHRMYAFLYPPYVPPNAL